MLKLNMLAIHLNRPVDWALLTYPATCAFLTKPPMIMAHFLVIRPRSAELYWDEYRPRSFATLVNLRSSLRQTHLAVMSTCLPWNTIINLVWSNQKSDFMEGPLIKKLVPH